MRELLTKPETFVEHPWGAVLEVRRTLGLDWPRRFEQTTVKPQTKPYTTASVAEQLETALDTDPAARAPVYRYWGNDALELARDLARDLRAEEAPAHVAGSGA